MLYSKNFLMNELVKIATSSDHNLSTVGISTAAVYTAGPDMSTLGWRGDRHACC